MTGIDKLIRSAGRAYRSFLKLEQDPSSEYNEGIFWLKLQHDNGYYADVETDTSLTISEISHIIFRLKEAEHEREALEKSEKEADELYSRVMEANKIMRSNYIGRHDERMRRALSHLGIIGNKHNKDGEKVNHRRMAAHYDALRSGNGWVENNSLTKYKPHSHIEAVQVIEDTYKISWESVEKACRRKGISLSTKSERYPIT